ncbi:MAG: SDR family NAD(P)-dependent oxidoreductase, partial [Pseudomonadota bacterium]
REVRYSLTARCVADKLAAALVTGANRGIGREVARQLAHDHAMIVYVGSRDLQKGEAVAAGIGRNARAVQLDVADQASVDAALAHIEAEHGRLDVLVNNAGVDYDTDQNASTADIARVRRIFDINLFGAWMVAIAAVPLMRKNGGTIVNVSSGSCALSDMRGGTAGYGVSKAALNALTIKLADELRRHNITVNAVCPGWVATDMGGGGRPIPEGAKGVVWAAMPGDGEQTGGFFRDGKRIAW